VADSAQAAQLRTRLCERSAADEGPALEDLYTDARTRRELDDLLLEPSEILGVEKRIGGGADGEILLVRTSMGQAVLKMMQPLRTNLSFAEMEQDTEVRGAPAIFMQDIVGRIGWAPRLLGVFSREDANNLIKRAEIRSVLHWGARKPSYAILLEYVPHTHTFKGGIAGLPPALKEKILQQLRSALPKLFELRLHPIDFDFMVSDSGRIVLHDLDRWYWTSPEGRSFQKDLGYQFRYQPFPVALSDYEGPLFDRIYRALGLYKP
jgi:hypothetical protein